MEDGDVIIQMGDTEISDIYDYMESLSEFKAGDQIAVTVMRDGEKVRLDIQF
jgi:S1-C subfamily serine protease